MIFPFSLQINTFPLYFPSISIRSSWTYSDYLFFSMVNIFALLSDLRSIPFTTKQLPWHSKASYFPALYLAICLPVICFARPLVSALAYRWSFDDIREECVPRLTMTKNKKRRWWVNEDAIQGSILASRSHLVESSKVPFTLASKNPNLSRIRVFRWKLLGNFP